MATTKVCTNKQLLLNVFFFVRFLLNFVIGVHNVRKKRPKSVSIKCFIKENISPALSAKQICLPFAFNWATSKRQYLTISDAVFLPKMDINGRIEVLYWFTTSFKTLLWEAVIVGVLL